MKVIVLGAGRVGAAIALDLAQDAEFEVSVVDVSEKAVARLERRGIVGEVVNLFHPGELRRVAAAADLVVGAVPGDMGFATLRAVLEVKRPVVDISFFPEDPLLLDELARESNVAAIVDCGIAPGFSNMFLGHMEDSLDRTDRFACYVGGLPVERTLPWEYKAPFSPADVVEEYTRPARYVSHGAQVTMPALSEPEFLEFAGVGTLEAFNTDGLRSLLRTSRVPFMQEKTMRYPGHIEQIRLLREMGFFGLVPVEVGGVSVRPRDLATALLFPAWELKAGEEDLTAMRLVAEGVRDGKGVRITYDLLDRYDRATGTTSMARTTGYTCTAAVRLLARGMWEEVGIVPPEYLGRRAECFSFIRRELASRGVVFAEKSEPIER
jgi:lysine 6-dehydrogenase